MVYVANRRLYLRSMSELAARPISGTETQTMIGGPVFSPDGRSVAYWTGTGEGSGRPTGTLKRIATTGGAAVTIAQADFPHVIRWDGDVILFDQDGKGIMRVSATGGQPELLINVKSGEAALGSQMLPGGDVVLFTVANVPAETSDARSMSRERRGTKRRSSCNR